MVPGIHAVDAILQTSAGKHSVGHDITLAGVVIASAYEAALRWGVDLRSFEAVTRACDACKDLPEFVVADWKHQPDTPEQFKTALSCDGCVYGTKYYGGRRDRKMVDDGYCIQKQARIVTLACALCTKCIEWDQ
jgi:hypothetical protein